MVYYDKNTRHEKRLSFPPSTTQNHHQKSGRLRSPRTTNGYQDGTNRRPTQGRPSKHSFDRPPTGEDLGMKSILDILDAMIDSGIAGYYVVLEDDDDEL